MTLTETRHRTVARAIEADVRAGRWADGRLPGVRALAAEYGVSVVTASRALKELSERGVVDTVERSGCFVRPAPAPAPTPTTMGGPAWGLCLRLTPGPWRRTTEAVVRDGFTAAAARAGCVLRDVFPDAVAAGELDRSARDAAAAGGIGGVFLLPSRVSDAEARRDELTTRACAGAGLPVVLVEREPRGGRPLGHDLVCYDDLTAGRDVTRHLLASGRGRPAVVPGSPTSSHRARLAGYLLATTEAGVGPAVFAGAAGDYAGVADWLVAAKADAVVCYQDYAAVGVILELLRRGVRVPDDVAVAGFEDSPVATSFALGVTTVAFDPPGLAGRGLGLMRDRVADPAAPPVRVAVPGRLVVRESTAGRDT